MRWVYAIGVAVLSVEVGGCVLMRPTEPRFPPMEPLPYPSQSAPWPLPSPSSAPAPVRRMDSPSATGTERPAPAAKPLPPAQRANTAPPARPEAAPPANAGSVGSIPEPTRPDASILVMGLLPTHVADRAGWATDLVAVFDALHLPPTAENLCAAVAVIGQESGFQADPVVPGLPRIAWREMEKRREKLGIPRVVMDAALALRSWDGRTYKAQLDAVRTEKELSAIFEDFVDMVPLGERFFGRYNPVRTGGPMQVSVDFAEDYVRSRPYPFPHDRKLRAQVFSRRGGLYFGVAHLLNYLAPYDRPLYRFADFNTGRFASRNAAFQSAVAKLSGRRLARDGDLLRYDGSDLAQDAGETQKAALALGPRLRMSQTEMLRDLKQEKSEGFERTMLYSRVFALGDQVAGKRLPRAVLPDIKLNGPKIQRNYLTTAWFAQRVESRYRSCLSQGARVLSAGRGEERLQNASGNDEPGDSTS